MGLSHTMYGSQNWEGYLSHQGHSEERRKRCHYAISPALSQTEVQADAIVLFSALPHTAGVAQSKFIGRQVTEIWSDLRSGGERSDLECYCRVCGPRVPET